MAPTVSRDAFYFETLYQTHADPWDYQGAAEQSKYRLTLQVARRWKPNPAQVLDVGCSLGYMTEMLAGYAPEVRAFDVSETAVRLTQARCAALRTSTRFDVCLGDALSPAYADSQFDVVFAGDVLQGVFESSERAVQAVRALLPLLAPGGVLIVTDFLNPTQQNGYLRMVEAANARVLELLYFNDRYWFRLKGAMKGLRKTRWGQRLLRSQRVFRFLARRSARMGPQGSKHFGLVLQRRT